MKNSETLWDISNRPSTKTKLEILRKCFNVWVTVWNKQNWVSNEWYVIDLFAGRGKYIDNENEVNGSPLIFLKKITDKKDTLRPNLRIKLFFVEANRNNLKFLKDNVEKFINENSQIKNTVKITYFDTDCNSVIGKIVNQINNNNKCPLFLFIDPTGLQIKKDTMQEIVKLKNPKDIIFNYILEGVRRTSGIAIKAHRGKSLAIKEIKTIKTLTEFIGEDVSVIAKSDIDTLKDYCFIFTSNNLKVVAYDMKYPDRNDILYYLLFASAKLSITNIVKDIYAWQKERSLGSTLFGGKKFYEKKLLTLSSDILTIKRKTLLYKTKVEYGSWTINHIVGCKHGCKFPCYAMMMAKKFGWVKDYEDWRMPRIAENALELLEKEIPKYKDEIDFVHLCFMSDPFMYDCDKKDLIPEIKEKTLKIIRRLNKEGIRVTTLTKGVYPNEILAKKKFLESNEYGITLVSLNNDFKNKFEPFSASYEERIAGLKKLSDNGLRTWVSLEPYPTPELDTTAGAIEKILEKISFVNKIIFGKLNYRRLTEYNNDSQIWKNNDDFYKAMAQEIINFCEKNNIRYHIKLGTPLSKNRTVNIFKE
ncbi:MAG: three-Cys-motif partner protein TcmP [Candidatus Stahlbacteria bacterium]|nr:three-Cys-motif partner protein TcmP [Candidatus Stahlbacteria bacterium]